MGTRAHEITIRPVWTLNRQDQPPLPARLPGLLVKVHERGSLLAACRDEDLSYRHGWDLVHQAEAYFGMPLLRMERGRGSTLTPLGEALVWADHRITARLTPILDSLASELASEISRAMADRPAGLRLVASYGFAVERLVGQLVQAGVTMDYRYGTSVEAASALHDRTADVAALHIPEGPLQRPMLAYYGRWLRGQRLQVVDIANRHLGLIVAPANPRKIYTIRDLIRPDVRFINRQVGSGTRFLLERLLANEGLRPDAIAGWEQGEATHAAVAACVASGHADVGLGLETPARQFHLEFVPLLCERYVMLCRPETLAAPPMQAVLEMLRSDAFRDAVDALPGYDARHTGRLLPLTRAFRES